MLDEILPFFQFYFYTEHNEALELDIVIILCILDLLKLIWSEES